MGHRENFRINTTGAVIAGSSSPRPLLVPLLIAALLTSGCADWGRSRSKQDSQDLTAIIVAARDIKPEEALSSDIIELGKMPRMFVSDAMLTPPDMEVALGRPTITPIRKGETIFWHQLEGLRAEKLTRAIRKRWRAVLLEVGPEAALIGQNDRLDVLHTFADPVTGRAEARVLLQNVIALGTGCAPDQDKPRNACHSVALLLQQEEAALLALARSMGKLTIALRNPEDDKIVEKPADATLEKLRDQGLQLEHAKKRSAEIKGVPVPRSLLEDDAP